MALGPVPVSGRIAGSAITVVSIVAGSVYTCFNTKTCAKTVSSIATTSLNVLSFFGHLKQNMEIIFALDGLDPELLPEDIRKDPGKLTEYFRLVRDRINKQGNEIGSYQAIFNRTNGYIQQMSYELIDKRLHPLSSIPMDNEIAIAQGMTQIIDSAKYCTIMFDTCKTNAAEIQAVSKSDKKDLLNIVTMLHQEIGTLKKQNADQIEAVVQKLEMENMAVKQEVKEEARIATNECKSEKTVLEQKLEKERELAKKELEKVRAEAKQELEDEKAKLKKAKIQLTEEKKKNGELTTTVNDLARRLSVCGSGVLAYIFGSRDPGGIVNLPQLVEKFNIRK